MKLNVRNIEIGNPIYVTNVQVPDHWLEGRVGDMLVFGRLLAISDQIGGVIISGILRTHFKGR